MHELHYPDHPARHSTSAYEYAKRALDCALALALLGIFAPLMLLVGLLIRCTSGGPAFYRQARVGRNGRIFRIYKFRTMRTPTTPEASLVTAGDDARITRLGKLLRDTKLDELPQLLNVLRGEMSFVGPRPQVPRFVAAFPDADRAIILSVSPGVTGPTQLRYRREELLLVGKPDPEAHYLANVLPTKCALDVGYVARRSLRYDLWVLLQTVGTFALAAAHVAYRRLGRSRRVARTALVRADCPQSVEAQRSRAA